MNPERYISILSRLGHEFAFAVERSQLEVYETGPGCHLAREISEAHQYNHWFIPEFIRFSFSAWAEALKEDKVRSWIGRYKWNSSRRKHDQTVALIMAGNIPAAGLHDLLCCIASGCNMLIKLSSSDDRLIPAIVDILTGIAPELKKKISFAEGPMRNFDAVIATGSNNTSRYFDYYFGKYPHIIRKNRNGAAVITGNEKPAELRGLAVDIFTYFGLGCRSVSMLYIPMDYDLQTLFPHFLDYAFIQDHNKYRNNYDYQKSVMIINNIPHKDNGLVLAVENDSLLSPVSVIHYAYYRSFDLLNQQLVSMRDQIQCIVSHIGLDIPVFGFGRSQFPALWDYADEIDTMEFLLNFKTR